MPPNLSRKRSPPVSSQDLLETEKRVKVGESHEGARKPGVDVLPEGTALEPMIGTSVPMEGSRIRVLWHLVDDESNLEISVWWGARVGGLAEWNGVEAVGKRVLYDDMPPSYPAEELVCKFLPSGCLLASFDGAKKQKWREERSLPQQRMQSIREQYWTPGESLPFPSLLGTLVCPCSAPEAPWRCDVCMNLYSKDQDMGLLCWTAKIPSASASPVESGSEEVDPYYVCVICVNEREATGSWPIPDEGDSESEHEFLLSELPEVARMVLENVAPEGEGDAELAAEKAFSALDRGKQGELALGYRLFKESLSRSIQQKMGEFEARKLRGEVNGDFVVTEKLMGDMLSTCRAEAAKEMRGHEPPKGGI